MRPPTTTMMTDVSAASVVVAVEMDQVAFGADDHLQRNKRERALELMVMVMMIVMIMMKTPLHFVQVVLSMVW